MDPKLCRACHAPHFNDYDLCGWCAHLKQQELERRLANDDKALSLMTVVTAIFGPQGRYKAKWRIA